MSSDSHGGTVAAWTAVAIIIGGTLISSVALPLSSPVLFFVGVGVIILGAVVGKVMSMMGMGNTVAYKDDRDPDYDEQGEEPSGSADRPGSKSGSDVSSEEPTRPPIEESSS
jgi:hypothetical protein